MITHNQGVSDLKGKTVEKTSSSNYFIECLAFSQQPCY